MYINARFEKTQIVILERTYKLIPRNQDI